MQTAKIRKSNSRIFTFIKIPMKLLIFCLLIPTYYLSQINVTDADLPVSGQSYYYTSILNTVSFDATQTGTNFFWDISNLDYNSQDSVNTVSVNSTPIAYQFFFNNPLLYSDYLATYAQQAEDISAMGTIEVSERYDYYKVSNTSFSVVGFGANINGVPASVKYDVIDQIFPLPLVYGLSDSTSSNYLTTIPSLGAYGQWIDRKIDVDGWGQLNTPYSSFDVIRLKTTLYQEDTVFIDQFGVGSSFVRPVLTIYEWYANGEGVPVLVVTMQAGIIIEMKYLDQLHVSNPNVDCLNFHYYPNPVNDFIFLETNLRSPKFIKIYNIEGVLIEQIKYDNKVFLGHLKNGVYLLRIDGDDKSLSKFIVKT
jgi:hypothetical protein